jgi:hypothetical protein
MIMAGVPNAFIINIMIMVEHGQPIATCVEPLLVTFH